MPQRICIGTRLILFGSCWTITDVSDVVFKVKPVDDLLVAILELILPAVTFSITLTETCLNVQNIRVFWGVSYLFTRLWYWCDLLSTAVYERNRNENDVDWFCLLVCVLKLSVGMPAYIPMQCVYILTRHVSRRCTHFCDRRNAAVNSFFHTRRLTELSRSKIEHRQNVSGQSIRSLTSIIVTFVRRHTKHCRRTSLARRETHQSQSTLNTDRVLN